VRGRQYEAAAREVLAHEPGELRLRGHVERGRRLVEEPKRPLDGDEARDGEAPPLAGRQIGGRQLRYAGEPDCFEGGRTVFAAAQEARPEGKILGNRERRLERVRWPR